MGLVRWIVVGFAVVALAAVGIAWVGLPESRSVAQTRRELDRALPQGSTPAEVSNYLDANSYDRSDPDRVGNNSVLNAEGSDEEALTIRATIPNRDPAWLADGEIWVWFVFNQRNTLTHTSIHEYGD